jgi:hypothetical protein
MVCICLLINVLAVVVMFALLQKISAVNPEQQVFKNSPSPVRQVRQLIKIKLPVSRNHKCHGRISIGRERVLIIEPQVSGRQYL